jgi:hypothetical protein
MRSPKKGCSNDVGFFQHCRIFYRSIFSFSFVLSGHIYPVFQGAFTSFPSSACCLDNSR